MAPQYKLTYFNFRGLVEPVRFILAVANVDYDDVRIEREKWPEVKPTLSLPFDQIPILEVDGNVIAQSRAIARYLALEHNLAGKTNLDHAKCDMIVDGIYDVFQSLNKYRFEADEAKKEVFKKTLLEDTVPKAIQQFQDLLSKNGTGFFVGDSVTWADLAVLYGLHTLKDYLPTLLDSHAALSDFNTRISNLPHLKEYLDKRPVTEF